MNSNNTPTFSAFLVANIISIFISLGIILTAFQHMPNVTNFISGLYLFLALVGYTGIIWFLLSSLCFIIHKVFKTLIAPSLIISFSILILFLDIKVYSLYRSHLSVGLLEYVVKEAFSELKRISYADIVPLVLGFILLIAITYFALNFIFKKLGERSKPLSGKLPYASFFLFFIISQLTYMYVDVINYTPIKKWTRHIPLYQPLTARRSLINSGLIDSSQIREFEVSSNHNDSSINYPKDLSCKENTVKPNILWLFIDTWRFSDYNQETTPNIYNWVESNKVHSFKNHWSVGNETIPSLFAIFYATPGLYIKSFTESGTTPIFISKLIKEDYQLQISTGWPIDNTSLSKNVFKEVPNLRVSIGEKKAWESDAYMQDEILNFLDKRDINRPYFSFMIFDSAHDYSLPPTYEAPFKPYSQSLNYLSLGPNTDPTEYHNKYKNSVHYIDSIIGKILNSPSVYDSKRPTVIVVTSDHGEQFNDLKKNYWGHSSNFSKHQLRVPMFVSWNGYKPKHSTEININDSSETFEHMTTHNDMSHTFLQNAFNCDPSDQQSVGNNMYSTKNRLPLLLSTYSRHGVLTEDKIYSYEVGHGYEVFDYNYNEADSQDVPKEIFKQYLDASTKFYN